MLQPTNLKGTNASELVRIDTSGVLTFAAWGLGGNKRSGRDSSGLQNANQLHLLLCIHFKTVVARWEIEA